MDAEFICKDMDSYGLLNPFEKIKFFEKKQYWRHETCLKKLSKEDAYRCTNRHNGMEGLIWYGGVNL